MEIIEAGKMIELIFIYGTINWFIDYRDRINHTPEQYFSNQSLPTPRSVKVGISLHVEAFYSKSNHPES